MTCDFGLEPRDIVGMYDVGQRDFLNEIAGVIPELADVFGDEFDRQPFSGRQRNTTAGLRLIIDWKLRSFE